MGLNKYLIQTFLDERQYYVIIIGYPSTVWATNPFYGNLLKI